MDSRIINETPYILLMNKQAIRRFEAIEVTVAVDSQKR